MDIIGKFVKTYNTIIADNLAGFYFLYRIDSGYIYIKYNNGKRQIRHGIPLTSHIESLWNYKIIPSRNIINIIHFIKESEYKYIYYTRKKLWWLNQRLF